MPQDVTAVPINSADSDVKFEFKFVNDKVKREYEEMPADERIA